MGWSSGSQLAQELWEELREYITVRHRSSAAETIIESFECHDADDWDEGSGLWIDSGRPTWDEEDE
jgi:hypothetical protein